MLEAGIETRSTWRYTKFQTSRPLSGPRWHREFLHDKITEKYNIDQHNTINQINKDSARFDNKLNNNDKTGK